jgi:signal transduction histidine kinase
MPRPRASTESPADLSASRARAVAAGDATRRRIQQNLHHGPQQRLVNAVLALKMARLELGDETGPAVELLDEAIAQAESASRELHELSRGLLPAALTRNGLRGALEVLISHVSVPVTVEVTNLRLSAELEATAYFIIVEALSNTVEHARAESAQVIAAIEDDALRVVVLDDGIGGASFFNRGTGLLGLRDRAVALGGELWLDSAPGSGTVVAATLPMRQSG